MVKGVITDRCPTGIVGFDKLCRGGFVRQSTNLLVGGPGSGKTTFLLQFLWNGSQLYGDQEDHHGQRSASHIRGRPLEGNQPRGLGLGNDARFIE